MPPITMLIKPASSLCNMRCRYCFYADVVENRQVKSYGIMDDQTLEILVRKALDYAEGICSFGFQGGEPTLAGLDFYQKLVTLQRKYNVKNVPIHNAIQTNGYAITPEFARFLADHRFLVGLSMDGPQELHDRLRVDAKGQGTYEHVRKTAKLFDRYGVEYNILCVVNEYVASEPFAVFDALKRYRYLQFIPCLDGFDGQKQPYSLCPETYGTFLMRTFDRYYEAWKDGNYVSVRDFDNYVQRVAGYTPEQCGHSGVCSCYFLVEGDGGVYPCDFYVLDEWKIGDVHKDSFFRMMKSETAKRFVDLSRPRNAECLKCRWYALCRGGCRRNREPFVNGLPGKNTFCVSYQMFFDHAYERMVEMAATLSAHTNSKQ